MVYSLKTKLIGCGLGIAALTFCIGHTRNFMVDVNGHKVNKAEYMHYVEQGKSAVYNHFYHTYGVQAGELEWNKDYGEGKPIDQLIENCTTQVVANNLVWQVAYEKGITDYYAFEDFEKVWEQEMVRRQKAHQAGEIVYGPLEMRLMEYYDYALSDLKSRVMDAVWEEVDYTDEQLEQYYETIKQEAYVRDKQMKGIKLSVANDITKEAPEVLASITKTLLQADDVMAAIQAVEREGSVDVTEVVFNAETARMDAMKQPEMRAYALTMEVGEISPTFVNDISTDIIVATEVDEEGYYSFEEMKEAVKQTCKEQVFDAYMAKVATNTAVAMNEHAIKKNIWEDLND
ncbi:MAG: hypothetical protein ACRCWY_11370 [Cellulosilyticaceae bacterium]